jgi:hypothetical protein
VRARMSRRHDSEQGGLPLQHVSRAHRWSWVANKFYKAGCLHTQLALKVNTAAMQASPSDK